MTQKTNATADPIVKMDSRKFLGALNESAQSKIAFMEHKINEMGRLAGRNWKLAALYDKDLYIEDVESHDYLIADHIKSNGKVTISNIRPIQLIEGEKKQIFTESTLELINALETNNQKSMNSAFNRLKHHRFSSRIVPHSGIVRLRDGIIRHLNITNEEKLSNETRSQLIAAIVEGLQDRVVIENGQVIAGYFGDERIRFPVNKWASRKLVARHMREAAMNAYWSEGFQDRIYNLARLISEAKVEEAIRSITEFLDTMEEFTLLTSKQTQTLIENALAAKAVFNQQLCEDTATLFYRTNLKINGRKVIDEWRNIAKKAEHSVLAENVHLLENARNFGASLDKFLTLIFEAISNRDVAAEALATTLNVLRDRTPKIKESHELSSKLNGLISRLRKRDFDDAAIYEAEDLIATIQEELGANDTLNNFDQIPGDPMGGGAADPLGGTTSGGGTPVININSPLIQIGGSSAGGGSPSGGGVPTPGENPETDPELEALLGGSGAPPTGGQQPPPQAPPPGGQTPPPAGGQPPPLMQGLEVYGNSIIDDPYAVSTSVRLENLDLSSYGAPAITNRKDLDQVVKIMRHLVKEHKLHGKAISENLPTMAKASLKALGLIFSPVQLGTAIEQAVRAFSEEWEKPWLKGKDEEDDEPESEDDDEGVAEDQYKPPFRKPRGLARSNFGKEMPKKTRSESRDIKWDAIQEDAMRGSLRGVQFIFDHGGIKELEPVILSVDGAVEIPIPEELHESAFASAKMMKGDPAGFVSWLSESLEQLRPNSDLEDRQLDETIAKITAGPDGTLSVEVSGDVEVNQTDDEIGMDDGMGGEAGSDGMSPVDSMNPGDVTPQEIEGETPDFDGGMEETPVDDGMGGGMEGEGGMGGGMEQTSTGGQSDPSPNGPSMKPVNATEEDDEIHFEDRDITSPPGSKYTAHVGDNKRSMPTVKVPGKTNDKLDAIGPELKTDDGSGTKPPVSRKASD